MNGELKNSEGYFQFRKTKSYICVPFLGAIFETGIFSDIHGEVGEWLKPHVC